MSKRSWQYILGGLIALFLAIQMVPVAGADNPPVEEEVTAPREVVEVIRQSCYDCHSHETTWPWYAHIAPVKWLVRDHVADAREDLNFSAWNRYDASDRTHKWEEVAEEVEEEHMPLRSYRIVHRDARLSDRDRQLLIDWALQRAEGEEAEEASPPPGSDG